MRLLFTIILLLNWGISNVSAQDNSNTKVREIPFHTIENNGYKNYVNPVIITNFCKVYSQVDTNSKVLLTLSFNTKINLKGEGEDAWTTTTETINNGEKHIINQYIKVKWYKIALQNGEGYIVASDVATHSFAKDDKQTDYFVVTDYSKQFNSDGNNFTIYKYDRKNKHFVDTLVTRNVRGDLIQFLNVKWKNVDVLIHAKMINAYCGGGMTDIFIVDANQKLSQLISTASYADDGSADSYNSTVWLPLIVKNKVELLPNGDTDSIFNSFSENMTKYPFPKGISVPKKALIVYNEVKHSSIYNKKGEPLTNKDGSYKSKKIKDKTIYYRWNGKKLVKLK